MSSHSFWLLRLCSMPLSQSYVIRATKALCLRRLFTQKWKLSSFVHNQVVSIIFFFCWTKKTTFWRMWITKQCQVSIDFHAMEVYGNQQLFGCLGGYLARWQNFHIWVKYPFKAHCHQTSFTCFCLPATIKIQNMLVAVRLLAWHDLMAFNSGIEGNMPICLRQYVSG